ncbi:MAG: energy transducer TonB [Chitinophagaceae bacterium]|nr:energy transducer TonB [Chitinophagaceae bacterium]
MKDNLQNPYDWENGETVSVQIKFVVGYDGKLQRFETQLDGGALYNKEVIRVLKKMPDWTPGVAGGEKVSVYYTIPVKFVMSN